LDTQLIHLFIWTGYPCGFWSTWQNAIIFSAISSTSFAYLSFVVSDCYSNISHNRSIYRFVLIVILITIIPVQIWINRQYDLSALIILSAAIITVATLFLLVGKALSNRAEKKISELISINRRVWFEEIANEIRQNIEIGTFIIEVIEPYKT